jgi:RNA binding exosome subunit
MNKQRLFHHVIVSVFCKPGDNKEQVLSGLDLISPIPCKELLALDPAYDGEHEQTLHYRTQGVTLTVHKAESDDGIMLVYTLYVNKISTVNVFARKLIACMTKDEIQEYKIAPALLLDPEGKLSLRLDKELFIHGKWSLTKEGSCYQVKASIAAYPKNKENTLKVLRELLTPSTPHTT